MTTPDRTTGAMWDERYKGAEYAFGTAPNAFLRAEAARLRPGLSALVPGDGEGRNGVWLAGEGLRVTSVEASGVGVAKARALAAERGVALEAIHADLEDWAWPTARFDVVASIFLHLPPAVRAALHRRMLEALVPGGLLILEAYTPRQLEHRKAGAQGGPPPEMLFTSGILAADFAEAEILALAEVETTLAEGTRHNGPASVVRLVARRRA
jgi:cyclopropane fatty-acyl-phospholipid synthase-like methyltransferase